MTLAPYVRLSYRGEHELGVKNEDKLKIVGIIKEETIEEAEEPLVEPIVPEVPDVPEIPEVPVLPSKIYTTKQGETLTSEQMAKIIVEAIEYAINQMHSTTDTRKKKRLQDKVRNIKLYVAQHDDIKQYIK